MPLRVEWCLRVGHGSRRAPGGRRRGLRAAARRAGAGRDTPIHDARRPMTEAATARCGPGRSRANVVHRAMLKAFGAPMRRHPPITVPVRTIRAEWTGLRVARRTARRSRTLRALSGRMAGAAGAGACAAVGAARAARLGRSWFDRPRRSTRAASDTLGGTSKPAPGGPRQRPQHAPSQSFRKSARAPDVSRETPPPAYNPPRPSPPFRHRSRRLPRLPPWPAFSASACRRSTRSIGCRAIPATPTKVLATGFTECGGGMAANASVAVARLGGAAHYWGRVGADELGARILGAARGRRGGRRPPCAACPTAFRRRRRILVADDGERLVCAYNDPRLDQDPSWLPLARVRGFAAVLADVRWPAGAAAVLDAARAAGLPAILDADVGPPEAIRRPRPAGDATSRFRSPASRCAAGTDAPGDGLRRIAGATPAASSASRSGPDGFLWRDGDQERRRRRRRSRPWTRWPPATSGTARSRSRSARVGDVATAARFANAAAAHQVHALRRPAGRAVAGGGRGAAAAG